MQNIKGTSIRNLGFNTTKITNLLKCSITSIPLGNCAIIAANFVKFNRKMEKILKLETTMIKITENAIFNRGEAEKIIMKLADQKKVKLEHGEYYKGQSLHLDNGETIPHGFGELEDTTKKQTIKGWFVDGNCKSGVLSRMTPDAVLD